MIVIRSTEHGEQLLQDAALPCGRCERPLRRHGYGRTRTVRGPGASTITVTPRRARCPSCRDTHVLLPAALLARRSDTTEVIGTALIAKARGTSTRQIAAWLGRPVSTVRRWLREADAQHADWLYQRGVKAVARVDQDLLVRPAAQPNVLAAALNLLVGAALIYRDRLGVRDPTWTMIGVLAGGRLLPVLRT